jgi:hypothetical protein
MVQAIPDPRWRLAIELTNAFGLHPEELHTSAASPMAAVVQLRKGGLARQNQTQAPSAAAVQFIGSGLEPCRDF